MPICARNEESVTSRTSQSSMRMQPAVTSKNLVARYYQIGESVTKFGTDQMRVLYKRIQIQDAQSDPALNAEAIKILNELDAKLPAK